MNDNLFPYNTTTRRVCELAGTREFLRKFLRPSARTGRKKCQDPQLRWVRGSIWSGNSNWTAGSCMPARGLVWIILVVGHFYANCTVCIEIWALSWAGGGSVSSLFVHFGYQSAGLCLQMLRPFFVGVNMLVQRCYFN